MDPITTTVATTGLTGIQEYGIAGIFLSFLFIGAVFFLKYFMNDCQTRHTQAVDMWKEQSIMNREVIQENVKAVASLQFAIIELKNKIDK